MTPYTPQGTVYGPLLNFRREFDAWAPQMAEAPYKGAPKAPVLYVKPANTWSGDGATVAMPAAAPEVEIGATIGMVFGPFRQSAQGSAAIPSVAGYVLMNDWSLPHASFYRPPVRFKCLDGFLGVGPHCVAPELAGDPARFALEVHVNGVLQQQLDFATLVRPAAQLVADVRAFMTLHPGDVLLLGCDITPAGQRPRARVGDTVRIHAPGHSAFGSLTQTLTAEVPA